MTKIEMNQIKKQAVNLTACLFLIFTVACSPKKEDNVKEIKEVKVEFVDKIVLKSDKSHLQYDLEKKGTCGPGRKFIEIMYNNGLWAIYFDEADQSVVYYNIDKEEEKRLELGEYIRDKQLEEIIDMVVYDFDKLFFISDKGLFTIVEGKINKFVMHADVNNEKDLELFHFRVDKSFAKNIKIINDSILISFSGLCGKIDTVNKLNCEYIAMLDFNTLKSKILPTKASDYFDRDSNNVFIPNFYSVSSINNVPYVRFITDSVLYNVYNSNNIGSEIFTKSIRNIEELAVQEKLDRFDINPMVKNFFKESLKPSWSQFFHLENEVYFSVCKFVKDIYPDFASKNSVLPVYDSKIDFYDNDFNLINEFNFLDTNILTSNLFFIPEKNYLLVQVKSSFDKQEKYLNKQVSFATFDVYKLSVEYEE